MYGIKCVYIQNLSPSILKLLQIIMCVVYTNHVLYLEGCVGVHVKGYVWIHGIYRYICMASFGAQSCLHSVCFFVATDLLFYYTEVILLIHKIMYYMFVCPSSPCI